jgi:outer membrane protein assembly factor BamB
MEIWYSVWRLEAHMRIDLYTKTILTLILLLLGVITARPLFSPPAVAADGKFAGLQFTGSPGGFYVFDPRSGDIWSYDTGGNVEHFKMLAPGQPLQR